MAVIPREPLRGQIRSHLVERLLGGDLEPGRQLNESELSEELGVSRTPLREALLRLEFEGLLRSSPGKGFSVAPLEKEEMEHLFSLGAELESLALRWSEPVDPEILDELRSINDERAEILREDGNRDELVRLDDRWHRLLVSSCANEQLQEFLRLLRNRLYRYVYHFSGEHGEVEVAIRDHEAIADALEEGEMDRAVERLREHWRAGQVTMRELMSDAG